MASRKDRLMSAAVRAAKQAKQWAIAATREADQLLKAAKKRAETIERKRQLKKRLQQTARVMKSAGKAASAAWRVCRTSSAVQASWNSRHTGHLARCWSTAGSGRALCPASSNSQIRFWQSSQFMIDQFALECPTPSFWAAAPLSSKRLCVTTAPNE